MMYSVGISTGPLPTRVGLFAQVWHRKSTRPVAKQQRVPSFVRSFTRNVMSARKFNLPTSQELLNSHAYCWAICTAVIPIFLSGGENALDHLPSTSEKSL